MNNHSSIHLSTEKTNFSGFFVFLMKNGDKRPIIPPLLGDNYGDNGDNFLLNMISTRYYHDSGVSVTLVHMGIKRPAYAHDSQA